MKKWIIMLMSLLAILPLGAQDYEKQWKVVERAMQNDQPRTVALEAQRLYEMAEKRGNLPQMLRAFLTSMCYRDELSPDSFKVDKAHLEQWQQRVTGAVGKSVLSLVLAVNTDDRDAAFDYYSRALGVGDEATVRALAQQKTSAYLPVVQMEKGSELFGHDMLSFLRQVAFDYAPFDLKDKLLKEVYRRDEAFYREGGQTQAAVQVALEGFSRNLSDYKSIDEMIARYGEVDELVVYRATQMQTYRREKEALAELREVIARFPNHRKVNQLKQMAENCIRPSLQFHQLPRTVTTQEQLSWEFHAYNVEQVELRWYKLANPQALWQTYLNANRKALQEAKRNATLTDSQTQVVTDHPLEHTDFVFNLTSPKQPGYYLIEVKPARCGEYLAEKAEPELRLVCVTDLISLLVPVDSQQWEVWAMQAKSGHPAAGVNVQAFTRQRNDYTLVKQAVTDSRGNVLWDKGRNTRYVQLSKDKDLTLTVPLSAYYSEVSSEEREQQHAQLFADRSLYRPGQTVQFSVMAFTQRKDDTKVAAGQELEVQLLQPGESKPVRTVRVKTDEMGVASGAFELPAEAKTGSYALVVPQRTRCNIRVEEYKRPTFEVTWQPIEGEYALGDTITVTGRAMTYAGVPVAQAEVNLKKSYREMMWWRMAGAQELGRDTLYTDEAGYFACQLALIPPQGMEVGMPMGRFNRFILDATVTSPAGESHDAQQSVSVSAHRFNLSLTYNQQECKEKLGKWTVGLYNAAGQELNRAVQLSIRREGKDTALWSDSVQAGKELVVDALRSLPSNRYVATLRYDTLAVDYPFTLFSLQDTKPMEESPLWVYATGEEMRVGEPLTIQYGTSFADAFVQINVYNAKGRVLHEEVKMSDALRLWKQPCRTEWGDGVRVVFTLVKDGKVYQEQRNFQLAKPDKSLQAEWTSFRDRLQPGEQETWTLRLTKNGQPVAANMMATMYDASLDAIANHRWNFQLFFPRAMSNFRPTYNQETMYYEVNFPRLNNYRWSELSFDRWADNVPLRLRNRLATFGMNRVMMASRAVMKKDAEEVAMADAVEMTAAMADAAVAEAVEEEVAADEPVMEMRTNFAETAFFYPMLRSDANGEVKVQFTLPESLTRWRMIGFAHTADLDHTLLYNTLTAQKLMMVQPQLPRFFRVGDEVMLTATVQNLTAQSMRGTLYVELTDSTLQHVVLKESLPFTVEGNSSTVLSIPCQVKDWEPSVICKFFAQTEGFSDGEQRLLPVLSDKVWLTENRAVYLNDETQQVDLSGMMNGGLWWNEHASMTVETIHNPLWVAVESLEELKAPHTNNAVDLASAYYAASIAHWLSLTYPALMEQKGFAVEASAGATWLKQLQELQNGDGGFSWFKGMHSSAYITRMVVEPFVRLRALKVPALDEARYENIIAKAMRYLDAQAIEDYHEMQKWEKPSKQKLAPGEQALHYLYLNALMPHALTTEGKRAVDFFLERLPLGMKDSSLYDKALATIVFTLNGKSAEAKKNLQSLLEYTVYTSELGRYYDTKRSMVSWRNFRIPVQTLLMEVLFYLPQGTVKVDPSKPALPTAQVRRELCQWLLNQRRTQVWDNSSAVMDALYALLLAPQSELKVSRPDKLYTKTEVTALASPQMPKTWQVERETAQSDSPMSWVSIAMTTYLPLENVRPDNSHTGLHVERNYFMEVVKDGETRLVPADVKHLQVGQKIVCRISLTADRDFDFVEVHNQRAAAFEPVRQLSAYEWHGNVGAYRSVKDSETLFYIDRLPKGEYELTETYFVSQQGSFQTGLTTASGTYCPEFSDHTGAMQVNVVRK